MQHLFHLLDTLPAICAFDLPNLCYIHPGRFRSEFDPIATRRRRWGKDTDGSLKKWFSQRLHRVGWPKFGSWKQSWVKKCLVNCLGKWMDILFKGEVEMLTAASCSALSDRKGWRRCDFVSTLVPSSYPLTWMFGHSMTPRHLWENHEVLQTPTTCLSFKPLLVPFYYHGILALLAWFGQDLSYWTTWRSTLSKKNILRRNDPFLTM